MSENNSPDIQEILAERGSRYGKFSSHATITQALKEVMCGAVVDTNWARLSDSQKECLDMVAHKIGRILNGDPDYADSWVDIVGYTQLVVDELLAPQPLSYEMPVDKIEELVDKLMKYKAEAAEKDKQPTPTSSTLIIVDGEYVIVFKPGISFEEANDSIEAIMTMEEWEERNRNK